MTKDMEFTPDLAARTTSGSETETVLAEKNPLQQVKGTEDLKKSDNLRPEDIVIIFMGPTGSGKSNMIDVLTGGHTKRANIGLRSSTSTVNAVRLRTNHPYYGDHLVLIDTPGFDDTSKTDFQILEIISRFLVKTYKKKVRLAGLVYLHRITDNRIAETLYRSFHVFCEICGQTAIKNVALVTTIWDEVPEDVGQRHEKEIEERLWGIMTAKGAIHERFDNTPTAAWNIIGKLTAGHRKLTLGSQETYTGGKTPSAMEQWKLTLTLQEEMITCRKSLSQTKAAQALYAPLSSIVASHDLIYQPDRDTQSQEERTAALLSSLEANQADIDRLMDNIKDLQKTNFAVRILQFLGANLDPTRLFHKKTPNK